MTKKWIDFDIPIAPSGTSAARSPAAQDAHAPRR